MEGNSGLPPEIMVLCTTAETKEQAIRLLRWVRGTPDIQRELAWEPAIPAVCSLIASEQLGNTVVTERRAQQWSQSTPEQFKNIMGEVQRLLLASRSHLPVKQRRLTLQSLVDEFCSEPDALPQMLQVEDTFRKAIGSQRWRHDSEHVQISLFFWICRRFKVPTIKSIQNLPFDHNVPAADFEEIQDFLDMHCTPVVPQSVAAPYISIAGPSGAGSPSRVTQSPSPSSGVTPSEGTSTSSNAVRLEELAHEFGVGEDALGGMRFLEKTVREKPELKDLVDWDSTMGRCVIFYWTCSVLKIPSAKHIQLRNQYHLMKRDFDKLLSVLDLQRAELRKKLEAFYAGNPALQLLPQGTQWPATSPAKPQYTPTPTASMLEKSVSPARRSKKGTGKRGRPPKPKSPPPISTDPTSSQEEQLIPLCKGPALHRALVLLRSFNARRHPASDADRVPPNSLPALVALVAAQQLGDSQMTEQKALRSSYLNLEEFNYTLATVRRLVDDVHSVEEYARQTSFDALALEHGLGIEAVIAMMHVREALKESRCLSIGMDWESPLVKCSVFFWTCAILKVSDVKQTLLRSRSLASKREFDSMLQLLNSHCTAIRYQLERDSAAGAFFFAPPPTVSHRPLGRQHPSFYGEQEIYLEDQDSNKPAKRVKREATTPSEYESDLVESQHPPSRKPGRPRKHPLREEVSGFGASKSQGSMYRPTMQFPPTDWIPPRSLTETSNGNDTSACPTSEIGESKRRHTRYKTLDYEDATQDRIEAWKPDGDDIVRQLAAYHEWEERMAQSHGPNWERDIDRVEKGTPFE